MCDIIAFRFDFSKCCFFIVGSTIEHHDPLALVRKHPLRCFGEIYQEKLIYYLTVFIDPGVQGGVPLGRKKTRLLSPTEGRE